MAKLINPSIRAITLPTGHVVPRAGTLETTNDVLRCPDNSATLRGLILSGALTVEYDPDPDLEPEAETSIVASTAQPSTTDEPPMKGAKTKGA